MISIASRSAAVIVGTLAVIALGQASVTSSDAANLTKSTCKDIGTLMPAHPPRVWLEGFSVKPPAGDMWCGLLGLYHGSVEFFAIDPEEDVRTGAAEVQGRQTWLFARRVTWDVSGPEPKDLDELKEFVTRWAQGGAQEQHLMASESKLTMAAPNRGYAATVVAGTSIGLDCVRYDLAAEHLERHGVVCLDPTTPSDLIQLEAYVESEPDAIQQLVAPATDSFLKSLWLAPATDAQLDAMTAAAERGLALAQFSVGLAYEHKEDFASALVWYQSAAEHNLAPAEHNIGNLYALGHGVAQSMQVAHDWFAKAIEHGATDSHYMLGLIHSTEMGDLRDLVQAYADFTTAAALLSGDQRQWALDALSELGPSLQPGQVVEGTKRSMDWQKAHPEY